MAKKKSPEVKEKLARIKALEAQLKATRDAIEQERLALFAIEEGGKTFHTFVLKTARQLMALRDTINPLGNDRDRLADLLRKAVTARPTGWVKAATVENRHLAWIAPDGTVKVELVDSPTYGISVEDAIKLIGLEKVTQFLSVSYSALVKAATEGRLVNEKGKPVSADDIIAKRTRKERAKTVKADPLDPEKAPEVVEAIDPSLAEAHVDELEKLGLEKVVITTLEKNGVVNAFQLRSFSGDEIARLEGIGPVRAAQIMAAIVKKAA